MPLNERKIISIILEQCQKLEERCPGYQEEIIETVSEILEEERKHSVQGTNIQQKINDRCNTVGRLLAQHRGQIHADQEA
ncbi:hypothetical protein [Oleispirillum naphthae]|uniref:hypothetical protein n=1 Tax=Oleispirillum naphthae TaxID=2838853 RepID=UPI003082246E